jgi:hypothetical protein
MATMRFADLKTAIVDEAGIPTPTTTTNVTIVRLNAFCNRSLRAFYALMVECYGDAYLTTQGTITATANALDTALPSRFQRLKSLVWARGTDDLVRIEASDVDDEIMVAHTAQEWSTWTPRFKMHGTNIRWFPKPLSNQTVHITYSVLPADLSGDDDTFEAGAGWESWVVYDVCAMIARRREKDPNSWLTMRADVEQRIRDQAPLRGDALSNLFIDSRGDIRSLGDQQLRDLLTHSG